MSIRGWMPAVALLLAAPLAFADLTMDQKISDFTQLAGLYARHYGPYEAKRDLYGFDLFDLKPWLEKIRASKTDLEFLDICTRYVASLRDSHDGFTIRSNYEPFLPLGVDVYDGKVLIDGIDRVSLPLARYPFRVGDEILSIDGKTMEQWIQELDPYTVNGASNPVSRARIAANLAIDRYQGWFTTSPLSMIEGKTTATVVILRQTGDRRPMRSNGRSLERLTTVKDRSRRFAWSRKPRPAQLPRRKPCHSGARATQRISWIRIRGELPRRLETKWRLKRRLPIWKASTS
jgi:hypothetical protein